MTGEKAPAGGQIRRLRPEDVPAAAALEQEIFGTPWSEALILDAVEKALDSEKKQNGSGKTLPLAYGAYGIFIEEELAGYLFCMAVAGEGELHRIAVRPDRRRKGAAAALMETFFQWLREVGAGAATLEVRAGNSAAAALYRRFGFREEGVRKAYYQNPTEDALIFWCHQFPLSNSENKIIIAL